MHLLRTGPHAPGCGKQGCAPLQPLGLVQLGEPWDYPQASFSRLKREPLLTPSAQSAQSLGQGSASLQPQQPGTGPLHSTLAATGTGDTGKPRHPNLQATSP